MDPVPQSAKEVSPSVIAAVLLLAVAFLRQLQLKVPLGVDAILEATGASRSRAYELKDALAAILPDLVRPRGRPPTPTEAPSPPAQLAQLAIMKETFDFVCSHPGCVHAGVKRRRYSDTFRRFIIELRSRHAEIDLVAFAEATRIPLDTLEPWLRAGAPSATTSSDADASMPKHETDEGERRSIELILAAWKTWRGTFSDFCDHVRTEWMVPFGRTLIGNILKAHGVRSPKKRAGRSPDELCSGDSFETFFPGAQSIGDGTEVPIVIDNRRFTVNVEFNVDAHTAAVVGLAVTHEENEKAVIAAYESQIETTGAPPHALLLDNKPSNHTEEVDRALANKTIRIRATEYRPQNKAHVEGAFGNFKREIPPLVITTQSPEEIARQVVELIAITHVRSLNHRPRLDRNGRSRVELYGEAVSDEQIEQARAALNERARKQELARATRLARADPIVRSILNEAFARLEFKDPEDHIKSAIARYPIDPVVEGIAIFTAKRSAGTLPRDVDARYLLGIIRNLADQKELHALSSAIVDERIRCRDETLKSLFADLQDIERRHVALSPRLAELTARALSADGIVAEIFFVDVLRKAILAEPEAERRRLFEFVARLVANSFSTRKQQRQRIQLALASALWPVT